MPDGILSALDPAIVWRFRAALATGLTTTILVTVISFVAGLTGAILLAILDRSPRRAIRLCVAAFVEFIRGTPLLVQAVWLHFALPLMTDIATTPLQSGIIALSVNTAAYATEIVRAGINAVEPGQFEAAASLGLQRRIIWLRVMLPQALRIMLPPLSSLLVSTTKGSALLSIIAVNDLLRVTSRVSAATFHPIELFTAAGLVYLVLGLLVALSSRAVEHRLALPR